jgi:murein DD-endopeptidase MepM/ murein hydrolase activator NlpD
MFNRNLFSFHNWRYGLLGATSLILVLWSMTNIPAWTLGTQFTPVKPRLGDTVVVNITATANQTIQPTIKVGDKSYPAFANGPNRLRVMIPTTPLEKSGDRELKVTEGKNVNGIKIAVIDRKFPIQRITLSPGKAGLDASEMELKRVLAFKATVSPDKLWNGKFIAPNKARTSSPYGVRRYYNGKFAQDYYHRGLDYAGNSGSAVVAPAGGEVVLVGYEKNGFRVHGNVVGVDHGQGVVSIFMHLSKIDVEEGQMLEPGDRIGAVGATGATAGPHLHWGLYVNGVSIDPVQWLSTSIE